MTALVLEMEGIDKSFAGVQVLHDVGLQVGAGEVHALMGENGAGKSTLMKILMGIYTSDAGTIRVNGTRVAYHSPKEALDHGIAMIHQELNPVLDMRVYENIFLGREVRNRLGLIDKRTMRAQTAQLLERLSIEIDAGAVMRRLSVAQCQLIEIAKAIAFDARIIIMDEPTSAISDRDVEALFRQIETLRDHGVSIVYISHKMDEIFRICDTITVLRDGYLIGSGSATELSRDELIRMMVGREIDQAFPKVEADIGDVVLSVEGVSYGNRVHDVSFDVRSGEILGIAGLVGAGRSELAEAIFGVNRKDAGTVRLNGKQLDIKSPADAIGAQIALITEDRKIKGLSLVATVAQNVSLPSLAKLATSGFVRGDKERSTALPFMKRVDIRPADPRRRVGTLSGGNQQKVVLAKWLLSDPEVYILDEPTRGIDVGAKTDVYRLVGELVQRGKAVVIISSEIAEIMGIADRILVMSEGRVTAELGRPEFTQERIMSFASPVGAPQ